MYLQPLFNMRTFMLGSFKFFLVINSCLQHLSDIVGFHSNDIVLF